MLSYLMNSLWLMFLCGLILSSCALSSRTISAPAYEKIYVGASMKGVKEEIGEPYHVENTETGMQQYYYVERIETGPGIVTQNTYIFTVFKDKIIDKRISNNARAVNIQFR